jgi:large subunit ribosomal protein L35
MPKMKTHSSAKKRFKVKSSGKVKRAKAYRRHLLTSKTRKRKRNLRGVAHFSECDIHKIKRLLPYG